MPIGVSYGRYSSDMQNESSIEAQHAAISRYALQHGIEIIEQYVDRGISGTTDKRPDFQRLISDLQIRPVDYVLVHKHDRFARDRYDAAIYSRLIRQTGARLVAVAQDFGESNEAILMESLLQGWAEYYSKNLSTEVIKGLLVKLEHGLHLGGQYPLGYENDGHDGYAIVEREAVFIRRFHQTLLDGSPRKPILDEMHAAGIMGRNGRPLQLANINKMLRRPVYAGIYDHTVGGVHVRIENHHPAIIPPDQHAEGIKIMDQRRNVGRSTGTPHLCSGIALCGRCGAPVGGQIARQTEGGKSYQYVRYFCRSNCGLRRIPAAELDAAACEYVNQLLSPEVCAQLTAALRSYAKDRRASNASRQASVKRDIRALQNQIDMLVANMSSGVLPPAVLKRMGQQITDLESRIEALEQVAQDIAIPDPQQVMEYFANAAAVSPDGDFTQTHYTLRRFIDQIIVHDDRIEFISTFDAWLRLHCPQLAPFAASQTEAVHDTPAVCNQYLTAQHVRIPMIKILFGSVCVIRKPIRPRTKKTSNIAQCPQKKTKNPAI